MQTSRLAGAMFALPTNRSLKNIRFDGHSAHAVMLFLFNQDRP
jgi:hypothetical protein